jgi:hypothetical protein
MFVVVIWCVPLKELIGNQGAVGYIAHAASKKDFAHGRQMQEMQYGM